MSNPLRGIGAVNNLPATALDLQPTITSLGMQYNNNLNGLWPNKNYNIGMITVSNMSGESIRIWTKRLDVFNMVIAPVDTQTSGGTSTVVAVSPTAKYIGIGSNGTPWMNIYKRNARTSTYTQLPNPSTPISGIGQGVSFSSDNRYLAFTGGNLFVYKIDATSDTFTRLASPTLASPYGVAFTPDNNYLLVGTSATPYINIYKITAGDTFTKLSNPSSLPSIGTVQSISVTADSVYVAIGGTSSPWISIYKIDSSTDTFTKLSNPSTLPGTAAWVSFSPDGTYLAAGCNTAPRVIVYKRSGDTFTKLSDLPSLPASAILGLAFSDDGNYLSVNINNSTTSIIMYIRSGDTFTLNSNLNNLPTTQTYATAWIPAV
jgi:DNA-binding beta-propeller fold protein YncE